LKVFEFWELVQVGFERDWSGVVRGRVMVKRGLERVDSGADLRGFAANGISRHVHGIVIVVGAVDLVLEQKFGEIEAGGGTSEVENGGVVGACGGDGRGVGTQPNP